MADREGRGPGGTHPLLLLVNKNRRRKKSQEERLSETEGKPKAVFLKMTKQTDHQYLAHDIFTGFQPNVVKCSSLIKDTIISEVNLQNFQFVKFYPCYSVNIFNIS